MKVVVVHGRYRSVAPSGENRVVDQEVRMLREAGHDVRTALITFGVDLEVED